MQHIRGVPRQQTALFPATIEEYVAIDHPVRVVDAFVDAVDTAELGFDKAVPEATGRPPYDPRDLLKLYLYGYLNQIRSSRRLERECHRNVELMWLLGRLAPDFKTIANFRKDNGEAIRGVCRGFVVFCREQELFGRELVAIDGSKFQAAASRKRATTAKQAKQAVAAIEAQINEYLNGFDDQADGEQNEPDGATANALRALQSRKSKLSALIGQMAEHGARQFVEGEPDAKIMRSGDGSSTIGYNLQTAVDAKHKLIVHHEVVNEANDHHQLYPMASGAKTVLEAERLSVVADAGYRNGEQVKRCEQEGIETAVPAQRTINPHGHYFSRDAFTYDNRTDTFRCPAAQTLTFHTVQKRDRMRMYTTDACGECQLRQNCTKSKRRWISRGFDAAATEESDARATRQQMDLRRQIAEHPFGTIKRMMGNARFLMRGLHNVGTEAAISVTVYNLLRVINILGVPRMLECFA